MMQSTTLVVRAMMLLAVSVLLGAHPLITGILTIGVLVAIVVAEIDNYRRRKG
jgi:hypothetical protein